MKSIDSFELKDFECRAIFGLFERFPEDDAYGVFFALLHKLEASQNYEEELIASVEKMPNEFNLEMIARMIRGGIVTYQSVNLNSLIEQAASNLTAPESSRQYAQDSLVSLGASRSDTHLS